VGGYNSLLASGQPSNNGSNAIDIIDIITANYSNLISSGQNAVPLPKFGLPTNIRILFGTSSVAGQVGTVIDFSKGIASGEGVIKATVSTGINVGQQSLAGTIGIAAGTLAGNIVVDLAILAGVTGAAIPVAAMATTAAVTFIAVAGLLALSNQSISALTNKEYNNLGDFFSIKPEMPLINWHKLTRRYKLVESP
jgi:hypothetical protein